ncbi:hypothetical protein [Ignicoccus hospitalis]|uniref:Uncharacterized protein n=1 Tax=Ignicoccus hospitalis (strain KIN4/I / DSM 18386 / JCM 14125) TaxID=453591 RepID=A8A907_IGNH4|nr:hypothetical protein [Ignicoccus hospitalis]ABU81409.1 hypothetical protein Igni_0225 [Ignicoccus hospitalis KIN4/I]HIH90284.1 hypothetical protein [Desulfurococcaceae archaeon]
MVEHEEPFAFVIESISEGRIRERLMSCLERKDEAKGFLESIMLSKREESPVICVTGKHLTPRGVYDKFVLVLPHEAKFIDDEDYDEEEVMFFEHRGKVYLVRVFLDRDGMEKLTIERL